ncbi:hypothetical protein GEU84_000610 [Fertoebacter nigrum]|uniref:Uncharacterized protein n=1 Tax=Fertoeibacter niger TaxID=2656921 RepID=A0A8X8GYM3_9RHOB|nr:hypothetical protein [Fertoeibacter niger]NUB42872.1 hypothetical protein [Fertoeibacter niger]
MALFQDVAHTGGTRTDRERTEKVGYADFASALNPANENPGALAGATGGIQDNKAISFKTEHYRNRADAATALCHAIAECDPRDAREIMDAALADLAMGSPLPVFLSAMDDARWWASFATPPELKAYALACFEAMRPKVRVAFLAHVQRGAVA